MAASASDVIDALREANAEARAMLMREGRDAGAADREASLYVSPVALRAGFDSEVMSVVEASLAFRLPPDLLELAAVVDPGTIKIWDTNMRPLRGSAWPGISDAYFAHLLYGTRQLQELGAQGELVVCGRTEDGDFLVLGEDPSLRGARVTVRDHTSGRLIASCATGILVYLAASSRAAAAYFRRSARERPASEGWAEEIAEEAWVEGVESDWLFGSISIRPRPT